MNKLYVILYVMVLLVSSFAFAEEICDYNINSSLTDGAIIKVYDYGKSGNSRFFMPNLIKIYGGCNADVLIHELAHYDNQKYNHDSFFYLSYYRLNYALEKGLTEYQSRLPIPEQPLK